MLFCCCFDVIMKGTKLYQRQNDLTFCLSFILIPMHYLLIFKHPFSIAGKIRFCIFRWLLLVIPLLFSLRSISNLFYMNSVATITTSFFLENIRAMISSLSNGMTFYWMIKHEEIIYKLISEANYFHSPLSHSVKNQLKKKVAWKLFVLFCLGVPRLAYVYVTSFQWNVKYYFHRQLYNINMEHYIKIGKIIMGFDHICFSLFGLMKLLCIILYISLCYFIQVKIVQFNDSIEFLKSDSFLMRNDKGFLLKQLNKSHSSLIEILSLLQTCFAPMTTLWFFDFLIATFYYIPLVATYFGHKLTSDAISKSIELWFHLYLMITLNLAMADINLLMTDKLSTLHLISVDIEPENKKEKYYFKILLEKIKCPSVHLTGSHYLTPSRELLLKAISLLLTYGVLMYQVFPDLFKANDEDWGG